MKQLYTLLFFLVIGFHSFAQSSVINLNEQPIAEIQTILDTAQNVLYLNNGNVNKRYDNSVINVVRCNSISDLLYMEQNQLISNKSSVKIIFINEFTDVSEYINLESYTNLAYLIVINSNAIDPQQVASSLESLQCKAQVVKGYYQMMAN